jgi:DNA-binding FrmR family transcriptional regulator
MNDLSCSFTDFIYNMRMQRREPLARKLQSATAYLETIQEMYQDKAAPLELVEPLQAVLGMLQEVQREVVFQELMTVLHNETVPVEARKDKVIKLFQLLT